MMWQLPRTRLTTNLMSKTDHPWIGVDNIIVDDKGKILLIKRSDEEKTFPGMWAFVSGMVEWDETIEQALKREAQEEIGCQVEIIKYTGRYYDKIGRHPTKTCVCLPHICKIVKGEPKVNQPEEIQDVKWFTPEEIREMELGYDHKQMLIDEGLV